MKYGVRLALLVASLSGGACARQIRAFRALPSCVCRGASIRLTWDATRSPVLSASPRPAPGWVDGEVASSGQRDVALQGSTEFRLAISGANPAAGEGTRVQNVAVVEPRMPRSVVGATCDAAARVVRGSLTPFASCGMALARMSSPQVALAAPPVPAPPLTTPAQLPLSGNARLWSAHVDGVG